MADRLLTYTQAIHEATRQEMQRDPRVFVLGLGVEDHRGIYGTTLGLQEEFGPDRVVETPLSEDGMAGVAIGAALAGLRPIHAHIRMDFLLLATNQLVNIAAKTRYMSGGQASVGMVSRAVIGRSWGQGAQHSQALHALFMHIPGLKVVAPTTPYDAKGCLLAAIRDGNPVIYVEHRMLHGLKGHVPEEDYIVPLGKARILSPGRDVTIVGISHMAVECLRAQALLEEKEVSAEILDPVTLSPLDEEAIVESVSRTGHLLVVDAGWLNCGASAEILARVVERLQGRRSLRVKRLGMAPVPCPTTRCLENLFYPDAQRIASAAWSLLHPDGEPWLPLHQEAPEIAQFKGPF